MTEKINWVKIMEDNEEAILDALKLAKRESFGTMSGWHVAVEMDQSGEVWTGGLASCGSQSMSSYNGETLVVANIESWTVDCDESENIKYEKEIYAEYLAQKDDENGIEYAWEFMEKKYPEIREQWQKDAMEYEIDEFDAMHYFDAEIENQKNYF